MRILSAMIMLGILPLATAARSDPESDPRRVSYRYYDVSGTTMEALEHSLDLNALPGPHGMPALALTEWSLKWSFQVRRRKKDCRIVRPVTRLSTTVTLPRWVDAARAPASLVPIWEAISEALSGHEQGHVAIAHEADAAVAAALSELPPEPTCGAAYRGAHHLAEEIASGYRLRDRAYDRTTRNGRTQLQDALRRQ